MASPLLVTVRVYMAVCGSLVMRAALAMLTCGSPTVVLTWLLVVIAVAVAWVITALLAITSPAFASPTALGHSCEMRAVTVT